MEYADGFCDTSSRPDMQCDCCGVFEIQFQVQTNNESWSWMFLICNLIETGTCLSGQTTLFFVCSCVGHRLARSRTAFARHGLRTWWYGCGYGYFLEFSVVVGKPLFEMSRSCQSWAQFMQLWLFSVSFVNLQSWMVACRRALTGHGHDSGRPWWPRGSRWSWWRRGRWRSGLWKAWLLGALFPCFVRLFFLTVHFSIFAWCASCSNSTLAGEMWDWLLKWIVSWWIYWGPYLMFLESWTLHTRLSKPKVSCMSATCLTKLAGFPSDSDGQNLGWMQVFCMASRI